MSVSFLFGLRESLQIRSDFSRIVSSLSTDFRPPADRYPAPPSPTIPASKKSTSSSGERESPSSQSSADMSPLKSLTLSSEARGRWVACSG